MKTRSTTELDSGTHFKKQGVLAENHCRLHSTPGLDTWSVAVVCL